MESLGRVNDDNVTRATLGIRAFEIVTRGEESARDAVFDTVHSKNKIIILRMRGRIEVVDGRIDGFVNRVGLHERGEVPNKHKLDSVLDCVVDLRIVASKNESVARDRNGRNSGNAFHSGIVAPEKERGIRVNTRRILRVTARRLSFWHFDANKGGNAAFGLATC
jgi:hypothetical protein